MVGDFFPPDICINGKGRKSNEILRSEYNELGKRLNDLEGVISGLLPVSFGREGRDRRIGGMNPYLRMWCKGQGFEVLDHWNLFMGTGNLNKRDRLDLNWRGEDQDPRMEIHKCYLGRLAGWRDLEQDGSR